METGLHVRMVPEQIESPRPSETVASLDPYDAVSSLDKILQYSNGSLPLKLDWNESTIAPSPRVIEAITRFLGNTHHLNWYPDLGARKLRAALTRYTGVAESSILVTNGSDDALDLVCRTYVDPSDDVLVAWPTYGHFMVFARARGIEPRIAMPADLFATPTEAILRTILPGTKLVYIASPNNPTGVVIPAEDVEQLCRTFPGTLFLIDEAYHEFCGLSSAHLVESLPNLVVTRTFSKCFGIAGLRVGYLMAGAGVQRNLRKLHNPKSVNVLAQVGALAAVGDREFRDSYIRQVVEGREILANALKARGADARATPANFVLIRVRDPNGLVQALESVGVFVRDRSHILGFDGYVRITVGTPAQMEDLVSRLDRLLARNPGLLEPQA